MFEEQRSRAPLVAAGVLPGGSKRIEGGDRAAMKSRKPRIGTVSMGPRDLTRGVIEKD